MVRLILEIKENNFKNLISKYKYVNTKISIEQHNSSLYELLASKVIIATLENDENSKTIEEILKR